MIHAASYVASLSGTQEITFVNIIKSVKIPKEIKKEFPNLMKDAVLERRTKITERVEKNLDSAHQSKVKIEIKAGDPTKRILKYSANHNIDLIIVGRKGNENAGNILSQRIARRAACSLIIVPEGKKINFKKVLVPIDFSQPSKDALKQAINLKTISDQPSEIITQHVYQVPNGYHYAGKTYEEFGEVMEKNARKEFEKFISNVKNIESITSEVYTLAKEEEIISSIYKYAKDTETDAIIIGAKGISVAKALFLGSSAEKLIQMDSEIPLFLVRPKGSHLGIIDLLKEL